MMMKPPLSPLPASVDPGCGEVPEPDLVVPLDLGAPVAWGPPGPGVADPVVPPASVDAPGATSDEPGEPGLEVAAVCPCGGDDVGCMTANAMPSPPRATKRAAAPKRADLPPTDTTSRQDTLERSLDRDRATRDEHVPSSYPGALTIYRRPEASQGSLREL